MQADTLKIYACNSTSHPINLWKYSIFEKDHKVLTEPFSYNRGNIVIIFHQFDSVDRMYFLVHLWFYIFEEMSLMFLLDECYFLC